MRYQRIAVLSYHTCPLSDIEGGEIGGMNIYVLELCRQLAEKGYEIDIFTRSQDKNIQKIVNVQENLRVIHIVAGQEKEIEKKKLIDYVPEFSANLFTFIDENKLAYDLVYAHYYLSGIIGLEIKKKYTIPLFVTFHTLALMKNLVARSESEREDSIRIDSESLLIKKADKIIENNDLHAQYLASLYNCPKSKISVVTPGIDLKVFSPKNKNEAKRNVGLSEDQKLILFVGRIEPLKAIDVLLYAVKILKNEDPQIHFCLWILGGVAKGLGKSEELKRLEKLSKSLDISEEVKFIGRKHQGELSSYYNASEIVVLPSHYESFGIVALEAMACGTPVIVTDTSGVSSIFGKKSPLVTSSNNPLMVAQKIKHLLTDKNEYQKISREVLEKAAEMSWENIAEKFIEILKN